MNEIDREVLRFLQGDLPLSSRPFAGLARQLGIDEKEIVARINRLSDAGYLRRVGAILRHQQAGFSSNAMVAWRVRPEDTERSGDLLAQFGEVSHCYLREVPKDFPYNLFTMVHASSEESLQSTVQSMARQSGLDDYVVLKSCRELKKVSMEYI
jgi:DNA-binding Lrp family transcriptional regulator